MRVKSPLIEQYHELIKQPDGTSKPSEHPRIRADHAITTGSRFPDPGYKIYQKSVDLTRYANPATDPISGQHLANPGDPNPPQDLIWQIDARQNIYYMGPFPAFYWPRVVADVDDEQPPLRQFFFRTNNYFGQQLLTDWNGFRFINVKKPDWIDLWNVDFDYLRPAPRNSRRWAPSWAGSAATSSRTCGTPIIGTPPRPRSIRRITSATSTSGD